MSMIVLPQYRPVARDWEALGCAVHVVVKDPGDLEAACAAVSDELAAIDAACSRFRADSELMGLDDRAGQPVAVSPLLAEALGAALHAAELTDGDVDPTVGSAMIAAGYDRDFSQLVFGGAAVTVVRRPVPGWRRITLDQTRLTVSVPAGVRLDLGATAKALAADRAARKAAECIDDRPVLVALGGDTALGGELPVGGWSIRVQDVTGPVGAAPVGPTQVISLSSGGMATSSTMARRWVRGGVVMHHILDPRNGVPVASPWRTVSVAAPTCLEANVFSTAAIVRGRSALEWLRANRLAARLVDVTGNVTVLPGWPEPGVAA